MLSTSSVHQVVTQVRRESSSMHLAQMFSNVLQMFSNVLQRGFRVVLAVLLEIHTPEYVTEGVTDVQQKV